jgi:protein SDA1
MQNGGENVVKRAVAVLTELWRQKVWRDAHAVNVIASATEHVSPVVVLAALKFFLGQDTLDEDGENDGEKEAPVAPTKEDIYRASCKVPPLSFMYKWNLEA